MRQGIENPRHIGDGYGTDGDVAALAEYRCGGARHADGLTSAASRQHQYSRYTDQPLDWRTRLVGVGGTASAFLVIAAASLITWQAVQPLVSPPALTVVNLESVEAPPEPVTEVPEGPKQIEQEEQRPKKQLPEPMAEVSVPRLSQFAQPISPPVEPVVIADPVPQTTAPLSIPAPAATRASSNSEMTWESLLLAHLEKYRRYPASARARREQGVVHVGFRMDRQGRVLYSSVLRSSGSAILDRAALDTLRRAQPLPAIPDDRPDSLELSVPVEFFVVRRP